MGGSGSTRRIEVDEGSNVITISESVVRRLKGEPEPPSEAKSTDETKKGTERPNAEDSGEHRPSVETSRKLREVEAFYEHKLKELEDRNTQLFKNTAEQFAKAVQEVEHKFVKTTGSPVCQDLQQSVLECYQAHPSETLLCSSQVKAFTACVERARQNALNRKG